MTRLCLNMIVKNEIANLQRCLDSLAPYIHCWVIGDTGSTDGTQDFIRSYFEARGVPGELHEFPFETFEQARNEALKRAYTASLEYDYLLFADADMEFVVNDPGFAQGLDAPSYHVLQGNDAHTYQNVRLLRGDVNARYFGVTHEYLSVPSESPMLTGIWFLDHADGANRVNKFERDIALLEAALRDDPHNERYQFYLAQSYRDIGRIAEAATAYQRRAEMGGWVEEAWNARLQQARCLLRLGNQAGFVDTALQAYDMRPTRAEPLYDLAKFYRERGRNRVSLMFSEHGMTIPVPDDLLFIENSVYDYGLREEFSIAAYYSPEHKQRGNVICNGLATSRNVPANTRDLARSNLSFYARSLSNLVPSFTTRRLDIGFPQDFTAMNPSVTVHEGEICVLQRAVNYEIIKDVEYHTPDDGPITTRNFLLKLDSDLGIKTWRQVMPPHDLPEPRYGLVRGFEDMRLFSWRGSLWGVSSARELNEEGLCEQVLARLDQYCMMTDWQVLQPNCQRQHQKNWMPLVAGDDLRFIFLCDPAQVLDQDAKLIARSDPNIAADNFRGGSQAIPFNTGWLAIVHEVIWHDLKRHYQHRFVWFDHAFKLQTVSPRFFLHHRGIEFVAGLAWHPDGKRLLVSYGVQDAESWIASVDATQVSMLLACSSQRDTLH